MGKKASEKKDDAQAEGLDAERAREYAQYDLLPKMTEYLDRHLVDLMLTDARESKIYKDEDVVRAILNNGYEAFLHNEEFLEWAQGLYQSLGEEVEEKWRSQDKVRELVLLEQQVMPVLDIFQDEANIQKFLKFPNRTVMCTEFEIDMEAVEALVPYAKKVFESGNYETSLKLLGYYMNLPQSDPCYYVIKYAGAGEIVGRAWSTRDDAEEDFERMAAGLDFGKSRGTKDKDDKDGKADSKCVILVDHVGGDKPAGETQFVELMFHGKSREHVPDLQAWWEEELARKKSADAVKERNLIWGALVSAILMGHGDQACAEVAKYVTRLDDKLNHSEAPKREILLHRTWLLHWVLFAIFRMEKTDMKVVDFFLSEKSLSVISLSCPHLFRYVGACLILQKRLKHIVKDTVWIIHHEASSYSDPITRFLLALYTEMDYDEAQQELQRCEALCQGDYFLKLHWQELQENARLHIFESYCRIHQCINIQMLAEKLNMQAEEAELWIVKLIQNAKLDARIDSEKSRVVMTKAPPNVYQQVIEKTKNLAFRSTMLVSNLEKSN